MQPQAQAMMPEQQIPPGQEQQLEALGEVDPSMDDDESLNEDDPVFRAALEYAMTALYESEAARDVAAGLKSAPNPVQGLAETSYQITEIAGTQVDGNLPDDLLPLLAMTIMQEVAEIGEAAGIKYAPSQIAEAFRQNLLRFLQESGADTSEIEAAMSQVDTAKFDQIGVEG